MRRSTAGAALFLALILSVILALIVVSIVQISANNTRTAATYTRGALLGVDQRNVLTYASRLLEANVAQLVQRLPAPNEGTLALQDALQLQAEAWCSRDPDGQGQKRVRVYFRADVTVCGQPLPSGVSLLAPGLEVAGNVTQASLPFVIVAAAGGRTAVQAGSVLAQYGAAPASIYTLLVPGDLNLPSRLRLNGFSQVDGILRVQTPAQLSGVMSASNCNAVTVTCTGTRSLMLDGRDVPVMSLTPSAGRPAGVGGTVVLGTPSESASLLPTGAPTLGMVTPELTLDVLESGEQVIKGCLAGEFLCTTYYVRNGNLYRDDLKGEPMMVGWNGVLTITPPGGVLTIRAASADAASVGIPLSLVTTANVTIQGNLTYEQTSCIDGLCNPAGTTQFLSVQAPSVTVTTDAWQVHGTFITSTFTSNAPLTLFGTIIGMPEGSDLLNIQPDRRALQGLRAPGTPLLTPRWRQGTVTLSR